MEEIVVDGEGQILGRMATFVVRELKQGSFSAVWITRGWWWA